MLIFSVCRDLRPASLEKGQELLRLRFYGAYAWGGPLIVAGLAIFLDNLPETPGETFLRPHFGQKMCWFAGESVLRSLSPSYVLICPLRLRYRKLYLPTAADTTCFNLDRWRASLLRFRVWNTKVACVRFPLQASLRDRINKIVIRFWLTNSFFCLVIALLKKKVNSTALMIE